MAMKFNGSGSGQHVDLGAWDLSAGLTELTVLAWVIFDSFTVSDQRIISKATTHNESDHWVMFSGITSSQMRVRLKTGGTTTTHFEDSAAINTGQLYHMGFVYDGSNIIFYRDGVQTGTSAKTGTIDLSGSVEWRIGDNPGTHRLELDGIIEGVRIYERALSADEIQTKHATKGADWIRKGLVHNWRLPGAEEAVASGANSVKDLVGIRHGTPVASPVYKGSALKSRRLV